MVRLLLVSLALTALTVLIHAMGTMRIVLQIAAARKRLWLVSKTLNMNPWVIYMVCLLMLLHITEIGAWAAMFRIIGLLPDFETALYFSMTSYTTVGYGDVVLSGPWRLLGPVESVVGVLMLGWSTGVMVAVLTRLFTLRFFSFLSLPDSSLEPPEKEAIRHE